MERAELGIDGNCGFALLGEDLQSGECEFVEIQYRGRGVPRSQDEVIASYAAYNKLKARLNKPITFYFGNSHPYGG